MKTWRADLHIHSRFSRATSGRRTVPHLAAWAGAKGIDLLATGEFTFFCVDPEIMARKVKKA